MTTATESNPAELWTAWTTSLLASAASFYFIEILHKPSAPLCWLERMLIFGLFLLLTVAVWDRDPLAWRYTVPFLAIGIPASLYQQLVHWDVIHVTATSCSATNGPIACTTKYFNLFGVVTQATLCLAAYLVVAVCMWRLAHRGEDEEPEDEGAGETRAVPTGRR